MPLDPSIPLAVQPPQNNAMNLLGQVMAYKGAQQEQRLRGLQINVEQQRIDEATRAQEDSRALTEAIRAHTATGENGATSVDYGGVTSQLARTGRGSSVLKWLDDVSKRDEQDYKTVQERLKATASAGDVASRNFQLVNDQPSWEAAKVLTKKQLEAIHPGMSAVVDGLPAEYSETAKQQAMTAGMTAKDLNEHLLKMAEDARKAPGEMADSQKKVREDAASTLGAATSQAEYTKAWDRLPAGVAKMFPSPETWNKETTAQHVRQIGMAPSEQSASDYRSRLIKVDEGNLEARRQELQIRQNEASAKDPTQSQDWREYTKADDDNWKNYQAAVRDASRNLKDAPVYKPLGTFAQWRAAKYPDGIPPAAGARRPATGGRGPDVSRLSPTERDDFMRLTKNVDPANTAELNRLYGIVKDAPGAGGRGQAPAPAPKAGAIHLTVPDAKAPGGKRTLEFDTIAARDHFLKLAGMTLKQ